MREWISCPVWEPVVRGFHGLNRLLVMALTAVGLAICNEKLLGISHDGRVFLQILDRGHVTRGAMPWAGR